MTPLSLVSIVIPVRNGATVIARCLDSIMALDYPVSHREVLVVDNGSTDGTAAAARAYPVTIVSHPQPGAAHARNTGIRAAQGEIVAFIDADCVAEKGWLRELLAGADNPAVGCFVGPIAAVDTRRLVACWVEDRELISQERLLSSSPAVAAAGNIAYRKAVFDAIGVFDEDMIAGEDGDLFWRMVRLDRFLVRYNRRARVRHAHPDRVATLLRRAFVEGRGLALFRLKHRNDLSRRMTSPSCAAAGLAKVLAGAVLCPGRITRNLLQGKPAAQGIAYPLLDKAYSICRCSGLWYQLVRKASA
jgi:glycosyltransferase involved in cell wall biosynthesis